MFAPPNLRCFAFALLVLLAPVGAKAATVIACQDASQADYPASPQHPCPVTTTPSAMTWQATMNLAAATSTTVADANVTKAPNSAATPASFSYLLAINSGTNPAVVCQFGGTASATAGCSPLAAGTCDAWNISPASVPTVFSTLGTALSFRNGGKC